VTVARQRTGRLAEAIVSARLQEAGWVILARNARTSGVRGELDLVALDRDELVFVEVKARRASPVGPETPAAAVVARKRSKIRSLALAWLRDRGAGVPRHRSLRFDVVGVRLDDRDRPVEYEHLRAAF